MLKASDFNERKGVEVDCKGVREWVNSEDAEMASRKPAGFRSVGLEEERESSREYEGWGKILIKAEHISERKQTLFPLLNLCKTSDFLSYYTIYSIAFPALVIKENSFRHLYRHLKMH